MRKSYSPPVACRFRCAAERQLLSGSGDNKYGVEVDGSPEIGGGCHEGNPDEIDAKQNKWSDLWDD